MFKLYPELLTDQKEGKSAKQNFTSKRMEAGAGHWDVAQMICHICRCGGQICTRGSAWLDDIHG